MGAAKKSSKATAYTFDVIHTLDARTNIMLEVVSEHFGLTDAQMFREIQSSVKKLRKILKAKGIEYSELKRALVPNIDRTERAFLFDWTRFGTNWYGPDAIHLFLPHLEKASSRSFLLGDWSPKYRFRDILIRSGADSYDPAVLARLPAAETIYVVYVNNLTPAAVSRLEAALTSHPAYLGSVDLTYMSLVKAMLSRMLVRAFIQHRKTIIQKHEDDRPNSDNVDMLGYDFAKFGFAIRSVPSWLYGLFLAYKIESPQIEDDDSDSRFSLNAMTKVPKPIADCVVELDERKLDYLQREKAGSLRRADFHTLSAEEISSQVRAKLGANYIYSLARASRGKALKFNIVIENGRIARNLCALEYRPQEKVLRVITLY